MAHRLVVGVFLCLLSLLPAVAQAQTLTFHDAHGHPVAAVAVGDVAFIRLVDPSLDDPGRRDGTSIKVSSTTTWDEEPRLTLLETGRNTGVFEGSIQLVDWWPADQGDGRLVVSGTGQLLAESYDLSGNPAASASAGIADRSLSFLDEAGESTGLLPENGLARIRLFTIYDNDDLVPDTKTVEVESLHGADSKIVLLNESGRETGIYEGTIRLVQTPRIAGPMDLQTTDLGPPGYDTDTVTVRSGSVEAHGALVGARISFLDAWGRPASRYAVRETVRLRVVDHGRNDPGTLDSATVLLQALDRDDSELVTLQETGFDTAVFEASVATAEPYGPQPPTPYLVTEAGEEIQAIYEMAARPVAVTATASIQGSSVLFVDAAGKPATSYLESSRAFLRVLSLSSNSNSFSAEQLQVQVDSMIGGDQELVTLTETGPDTSVFAGSIRLALLLRGSSGSSGSGILETAQAGGLGDGLDPHEFDTLRATFTDVRGTSTAEIGLTGSRTWFADASGREVLSFAVGSRVHVWVEDQNRNDPGERDQTEVQVSFTYSGVSSDTVIVQLQETSRTSGLFTGSFETRGTGTASGYDDWLRVRADGQITAVHFELQVFSLASTAVADITDASLEFIDETGARTEELLQNAPVRVRLFSSQANSSQAVANSVSIQIRTLRSNDYEQMTVTETGPNTGVFEGSIPSVFGSASSQDGVLQEITSGTPSFLPEEVTAWYTSNEVTARVAGARLQLVDAFGRITTSYAAGETVRLRVVDPSRNDAQLRDQVYATVLSQTGGESEIVQLTETGFDTAVFAGSVRTVRGDVTGSGDGVIRVAAQDRVEARYNVIASSNPVVAEAAITGNALLFIDAAGQPATVYLEGSRAYVRALSTEGNGSSWTADTIAVQIEAELSQDMETVTLTETGPDTSVFEGSIQLRLNLTNQQQNNGILETEESGGAGPGSNIPHEFDVLKATLTDPSGTSVVRIGLTGSRTWFADASGAEVSSYAVGGTAWVRVEDQNRNDPAEWDRVMVELRSLSTGDLESLTLLETTRASGIFSLAVPLTLVPTPSHDGSLTVQPGEQIEARHNDYFNSSIFSSAVADIADTSIEFIDETGEVTAELLENDRARVRMFSLSFNQDQSTPDTATVELKSLSTGDVEPLQLTETGPNTNVFEGSLPLEGAYGSSTPGDGMLGTRNSGPPEYRQDEVTVRSGLHQATARVAAAQVVFLDAYGRETSAYAAGETARVRVIDHSRNSGEQRDLVYISVLSQTGGESEIIQLNETGFDTAMFEGTLRTVRGSATGSDDGAIRVAAQDRLEARYNVIASTNPIVAAAVIRGNAILFIDKAGQPATVYLEGSRAYVRAFSLEGNGGSSTADTIAVQIEAELSRDTETLSLTETGPNTSVFEGSIQLRLNLGSQQQDNGILETEEDGGTGPDDPPHEFDVLKATLTDPSGTSVARIGLTGSRTWFADASGAEVLSYAVGGTAWVRVEDQNRNDPAEWDQVQAELRSLTTGDVENLTLRETSRASGIFALAVPLTREPTPSHDGQLSVQPGEQIEARHADYFTFTVASSAIADIADTALEFIDETGEVTAELLENDRARVRMFSLYFNQNPGTAETATVELKSLSTGDVEQLQLTETGPDTNVFEGSLPLEGAYGSSTLGDGTLGTRNGGAPEYRQDEVTVRSGLQQATARVAGARVVFLDAYGRQTSGYAAGETVRVRVVDQNRNSAEQRDQTYVTVQSQTGGESEILQLNETGFDTAMFEGTLRTVRGVSTGSDDGAIRVASQDRVEARYYTMASTNQIVAEAAIAGNGILFIDQAGQPATVYLEGSRAYVRAFTTQGNSGASTMDTIAVQLEAELSNDTETLTLTETGPNTSVFEGSIQLRLNLGSQQQDNGILETEEDGGLSPYDPPHEFDVVKATLTDPLGTAVARISLTGSRTWFADATGAEVSSYAVGGTAWVRVEDQNRNDPAEWDQVVVELRSLTTGDIESLTLRETTRASGIFALAVPLTRVPTPSHDGSLSVQPGEQIEARHQDYFNSTVSSSAVADIADTALEFIDESGEATAELLENDRARVRMFSLYSNQSQSTADTVTVEVKSLYTGDVEQVQLTETGPNTSVFEGFLPLEAAYGPGTPGDGTLSTRSSGAPEYRQDEITASFFQQEVTARVAGARVVFLDAYGRQTSGYAAGETVRVRVVDRNRNSAEQRDQTSITVQSQTGGESEILQLNETGFDTGVFEGSVRTVRGSATDSDDGAIRVASQDRVEARYYIMASSNQIVAEAAIAGNGILFVDQAGQPATVYLEGSRAYVRAFTTQGNTGSSMVDTIAVQLEAELSNDTETLTLTETGPNTSVFEGSIQLRLNLGSQQQDNGILETEEDGGLSPYDPPHEYDVVKATLTDASGTAVARIGLTGSRTWFADATGAEVSSYAAGGTAWVRVEDQNRNDPAEWDRVMVELRSLTTGDVENLTLRETTRASGIFAVSVPVTEVPTPAHDGSLSVQPGEQIEARHQDYFNSTVSSSAIADIVDTSLEFIDETGEATAELLENDRVRVRMFNLYANYDHDSPDLAYVEVTSLHTGDAEQLTLTETGPNTMVFEGSLPLEAVYGPGTPGDGTMSTRSSGTPEYRQDEITASFFLQKVTARVAGARVVFLDAYGRQTSGYAAGETARVRVVDHNRNSAEQRDQVYVTVLSQTGGESEIIQLNETGFDTGVFEGSVQTVRGSATGSDDGAIRVASQDRVEARYYTMASTNQIVAEAAIAGNGILFIDQAGQPATVYLEGSRAYVRAFTAQGNTGSSTVDTIAVQLEAELSHDTETLSLTETGPNTSVFEGSIKLRLALGSQQQDNGILETEEDGGTGPFDPPHEFDVLKATLTDPTGTAVARIGLTGSRTWFADASGAEVLSYVVGGTAWVRVEDQNRNDPGSWDQVMVELRSLTTGNLENLSLLETARGSGIFTASIALDRDPTPNYDGRLSVQPGEQIEARHQDYFNSTVFSSAVADIGDTSLELIDANGEATSELLESDRARVRMFSLYFNQNPAQHDIATVEVRSLNTGDAEQVELFETGENTNLFEGSVPTAAVYSGIYPNDGTLSTRSSGAPEYRQDEVTVRSGTFEVTARVVGARVVFLDAYGRETAAFAAGETVRVRVVDHSRNLIVIRDQASISVQSENGGESELLILNETGLNTGTFEGPVKTVTGRGTNPDDGEIAVEASDRVVVQYYTQGSTNAIVAEVTVNGSAILFIDAAGQPATVYLEGSRAFVRVVSAASNVNVLTVDTLAVQLLAELSQDSETLILTETTGKSSVFEGSIQLRLDLGAQQSNNGVLETSEAGGAGPNDPHEYDTLLATFTGPAGTSTARVGLTGSRTWFADAAGAEVSSYPVGATAWVRVEDQNQNVPGTLDQVMVQVTSAATGDQENLTLQETSPDSGVFKVSVTLTRDLTPTSDGSLSVQPGDQIEARHQNAYSISSFSTAVAGIAEAAIEFIDEEGQPTSDFLENGLARVRVLNLFADADPAQPDLLTVHLQSRTSYDTETASLTETGPHTGIFEGSLRLAYSNPGPGDLISYGRFYPEYSQDEITATYGAISAQATVALSRVAFLNLRGEEVSTYPMRSAVRLRVIDYNPGNGFDNPGQPDTLSLSIRSLVTEDMETVTLTETGNDTHVYEGTIQTISPGGGTGGDGVLDAPTGLVDASYMNADVGIPTNRQAAMLSALAPVAGDDPGTTLEDEAVVLPVLVNDSGTGTLTVEVLAQPAHGTATANPDGTVTYTPTAGYFGSDTFSYLLIDSLGGEDVGEVFVTVTPGNQPPTPFLDEVTTPEDQPVIIAVLANDTDPNQDPLDVIAVTQPQTGGTVILNADDTLTFTPAPSSVEPAYFSYTVRDPDGAEEMAPVHVTVTELNDAPVASDDAVSVPEDGIAILTVLENDSDVEGHPLQVVSVTQGAHGQVTINPDGTLTYAAEPDFNGTDTFTYTISDGNGGTATASVTVTVTTDNDAPVAGSDSVSVVEDGSVTITVLANDSDPDNDALDVTSVTQGAHGTVTLNANDTVTYAPAANYHGLDLFTYTISDGNGGIATASVTITVSSVNDEPVANVDTASTVEDGLVTVTVLANDSDADNDALDVVAVTQGTNGTVTLNADNTVTYAPAPNFHGTDLFTYTIEDGNGGIAAASVSVTVTPVNDAPAANADSASVSEDDAVTITVLGNDSDVDNDVLSVTAVTQGASGTVAINPNKTITYTPAANYNGGDAFTYTVSDGNGGTATAAVTVTITAANDAPVAVNDTATTTAETLVAIAVKNNDVDVDGPSLTVTAVTQPAHGTASINGNQTINYTPATGYKGADSFTYTVSDGAGGTATATVNVTVNAPARVTTNLQALYELEEGSGTTVTDTSGVGTPLNLTIGSSAAVSWISGGLSVNSATLIQSAGAATKVITASQATNAITIEAWVEPSNLSQSGPAPIVTVSQASNKRNFTLGQSGSRWDGRLRTSNTNQQGSSLTSAVGTVTLNPTHVVFTRDSVGNIRIYVNGVQSSTGTITGSFSAWTGNYKLGLANELSAGSPWLGDLYLVAIYNRALSAAEVRTNWLAGE